jgi:hypothetical protein
MGNRSDCLRLRREDPRLNACRRSVREEAPLQSQFSECRRFGRSRIEEQRSQRGMRMRNEREFIDAKIDAGKFCVVARPAFGRHRKNRAQNLAALDPGWRQLRLCRLGMKRTIALFFADWICDRAERTMIRNCQPRRNRDRNGHRSRDISLPRDLHPGFQSPSIRRRSNIFSWVCDLPYSGCNSVWRHRLVGRNRCLAGLVKLRLLNARRQQHRREQ